MNCVHHTQKGQCSQTGVFLPRSIRASWNRATALPSTNYSLRTSSHLRPTLIRTLRVSSTGIVGENGLNKLLRLRCTACVQNARRRPHAVSQSGIRVMMRLWFDVEVLAVPFHSMTASP